MSEPTPGRTGRLGWALLLGSLALTAVVMMLGPSATEAVLPGSAWMLRWHVAPGPAAVTGLLAVAVLLGAAALWCGLTERWRPSAGRLLAVGLIATAVYAVAPPVGSADQLSYASYGRMVVTGHDPWSTTPASRAAAGDPVARAVEAPWQDTPSVYGPVAAGEQALAARIGGTDVAAIVELLDLAGALAVAGAGAVLWRVTRRRPEARRRTMLLWSANPLVLIPTVAGGHVDALVGSLTVVALALAVPLGSDGVPEAVPLWRFAAAGAVAGIAADAKLPALLIVAGLLLAALGVLPLPFRTTLGRAGAAAAVLGGAALTVLPAYLAAGPAVLHQLHRASQLVSAATPWRPAVDLLQLGLARGTARTIIGLLVIVVTVALAGALLGLISGAAAPWWTAALLTAYFFASAYALPWYDVTAWGAVAMLAVSLPTAATGRITALLGAHTVMLTVAYLPGRAAVTLAGATRIVTEIVRSGLSPAVLALLMVVTAAIALRYHRTARGTALGPVVQRRVLPSTSEAHTPRQERGTQPRS